MPEKVREPVIPCVNCGSSTLFSELPSEDWKVLTHMPWCKYCYEIAFNLFKEKADKSREGFLQFWSGWKNDPARAEVLMVQLQLAKPCGCNNCHARR